MEARFIGGPLDGQLMAVQGEPHFWRVVKPEPIQWTVDPPSERAIMPTTGTYRRGHWNDGSGHIFPAFEWMGWEGETVTTERLREAYERPIRRPVDSFTMDFDRHVLNRWTTTPRLPDEPGPDAMRWTPDEADAEIEAWRQILHP